MKTIEAYQVFGVELCDDECYGSSDYYFISASSIKEILDWFSKNLEKEWTPEFPLYVTKKTLRMLKEKRDTHIKPIANMYSDKKLVVLASHCY